MSRGMITISHGTFAAAINCMGGRTQPPVIEYLKSKYGVDYVDAITEPGPNRILAENRDQIAIDSIRRGLEISVMKHGSKHVVIVGHHDCTRNPTDKETQLRQIAAAFEMVKSWEFPYEITGLWVDEQWKVHEV